MNAIVFFISRSNANKFKFINLRKIVALIPDINDKKICFWMVTLPYRNDIQNV